MIKKIFLILLGGLFWLSACNPIASVEPTMIDIEPTKLVTPVADTADWENLGLTASEVSTLESLKQVDDYPLYQMTYLADYDVTAMNFAPHSNAQKPGNFSWACSLFAALADPEARLYGRNFDWEFSPALLLYTDPPDGYASVAMVDIAYLGFAGSDAANLTEKPIVELNGLLAAPFIPFDGLNETGLAIGMAAVPPGKLPVDSDKATLGSLSVIRVVLDQAATVDEAVKILQSYNIDFEGGPSIHYLIADQQGRAALLEHQGGEVHILWNDQPWHQATNYLNSAVTTQEGNCQRYDTLSQTLDAAQGALTTESAMDLLGKVAQNHTQWSIVYGMHSGEISIAMGGDYQKIHRFEFNILHNSSEE